MPLHPPTFQSLVDDPVYRRYVKTVPHLPNNLTGGNPWAVWAITQPIDGYPDGRWRGAMFATYAQAWAATLSAMRNTARYRDVSLVSRRAMFHPPIGFVWDFPYEWCPRCRRPTLYRMMSRHHAVTVLTSDDPYRCYFCGIRRSFAGWIDLNSGMR